MFINDLMLSCVHSFCVDRSTYTASNAAWKLQASGQAWPLMVVQKAAIRACRHAIEFTDLPCIHDVVPERYQGVKLKVQVACPSPGMVDVCELRRVFPFGTMEIDVGEGGMRTHSCSMVPELGEGSDDMFVAVAAVTVGY